VTPHISAPELQEHLFLDEASFVVLIDVPTLGSRVLGTKGLFGGLQSNNTTNLTSYTLAECCLFHQLIFLGRQAHSGSPFQLASPLALQKFQNQSQYTLLRTLVLKFVKIAHGFGEYLPDR